MPKTPPEHTHETDERDESGAADSPAATAQRFPCPHCGAAVQRGDHWLTCPTCGYSPPHGAD